MKHHTNDSPVATLPRILLCTGFVVALYNRHDPLHGRAARWVKDFHGCFVSVEAVLTEAAYFMGVEGRASLLDQVADDWVALLTPDTKGLRRIAATLRKHADLDPDLADACLVWLAETTGVHSIVTVDATDFSTCRIGERAKFDLVPWQ